MSDFKYAGSVSNGTHRPQDLIPRFLEVLRELDPAAYEQLLLLPFGPIPSHAQEDDDADWWGGEEASMVLEDLFAKLEECAPEGYYFGAHEGDGSDFGFWKEVVHDAPDDGVFSDIVTKWRTHHYREARDLVLDLKVSEVREFLEAVSNPESGLCRGPGEAQAVGVWTTSLVYSRIRTGSEL